MFPKIKKNSNRFYLIILAYITILVVLSLSLITTLFQMNYDKFISSLMYSYSKESLVQVSYSANFMSESSSTISKQIYFDPSVNFLMYFNAENNMDNYSALTRLKNYVGATNNISSVYIYNASENQMIYTSNDNQYMVPAEIFFDKEVLDILNSGTYSNTSPIPRTTALSEQSPSSGGKAVYTYILVDKKSNSSGLDGAIVINYSEDWLYQTIHNLDKSPDSTTFIIDSKGKVASQNSAYPFLMDISKEAYVKQILAAKETSGYFTADINGIKSFITFVSSDKPDWRFIRITPFSSISSNLNKMKVNSILVYILILIIGILASVFISKKLYKPYRSMDDNIKALESKNRNNFFYYKQDFLQNLLTNSESFSEATVAQKYKEFNIKLTNSAILIILFKIDGYGAFCNKYNLTDRDLFKFGIANIISEICGEHCENEAVITGSDHIAMITCTDDIELANNIGKKCCESVLSSLDISCSVTITATTDSVENLSSLYKEAIEASYDRMFKGYGCIIHSEEVLLLKKFDLVYPEQKEKQLLDCIMLGRTEDAKKYYEEIIFVLSSCRHNSFIQMITRLSLAISLTANTLEKNNDFNLTFNFNNFISELDRIETIDTINDIFFRLFDEITESLSDKKSEKHDKIIETAISIINDVYSDINLTPESIADKINVSSSHLRRVFKRLTNQTLSNYIIEVRMNKAKELLKSSSLSVGEISDKTGFVNSSYFFTAFKKLNGVTPNVYRQTK